MCAWSEDEFMYFISPWHHLQMKLTRHSQEGWHREKVLTFFYLCAWWLCASARLWGFRHRHPHVYIYVNHRFKNICWHIVPTSTWKSSPAPSQSFEVMTGVWICTKPFSLDRKKGKKRKHIINIKSVALHSAKTSFTDVLTLKYEWIAVVASLRTLSRELKAFVLQRRWGNCRIYSRLCLSLILKGKSWDQKKKKQKSYMRMKKKQTTNKNTRKKSSIKVKSSHQSYHRQPSS